mmetsp:Transcript_30293/g.46307  ORF Transcript_30293/g.46307 Transcript_30293/m.46307 type:complete len:278 (-) Transcript_30293:55-888(-)
MRDDHRNLSRQPELLVPVDGVAALDLGDGFRLVLLALELTFHVGIDLVFTDEAHCCVHCRQILTLEQADFQLVELRVQSWGHHDLGVLFDGVVLVNLNLLVSLRGYRDGHLQVGADLRVVIAVGVAQSQPLVQEGVVLHKVNEAEIELKLADQSILEDAFVHELDQDLALLSISLVDASGLQEEMLAPEDLAHASNVVLSGREYLLVEALHLDDGVHSRVLRDLDVLGLLDEDVNHIVSMLHLTNATSLLVGTLLVLGFFFFLLLVFTLSFVVTLLL